MKITLKEIRPIIIITIATAACYINTLHNPFIWDQEVVILGNPLIRSWDNLPVIFRTNVEGRRISGIGFYRPMEVISYMIDYTFWKFNPFGYHLSSMFLHLCNALLLFWLLQKINIKIQIGFLASLIFAIHPLNTESVTYSIRGDLLGASFSLLCFLSFLYFVSSKPIPRVISQLCWGGLSVFAYILALFSKESASMLPAIILVYLILFCKSRKAIFLAALLLSLSLIYIFIRFGFISTSTHHALSLIGEATLRQRILTTPRIILTYIRLLIFPWRLHMEYHFVERSLAGPYVRGGALFLIVIGAGLLRYIKRVCKLDIRAGKDSVFFLFWFLLGLVPFYNIIVPLHATIMEHWLYFPGIGFIVSMVILGSTQLEAALPKARLPRYHPLELRGRRPTRGDLPLTGMIILLIYYGCYTIKRNVDWGDAMRLYQHDLKYEPDSFILHNNVGVIYFRRGDFEKAKEAFLKSIEVSPGRRYDVAHNNLGVIYENDGDLQAAEKYFKASIQLNNYELAYGNLSRLYLRLGRIKDAVQAGIEGKKIYPMNPEINYYLASGYYCDRQFDKSLEVFQYLSELSPGYKDIEIHIKNIKPLL